MTKRDEVDLFCEVWTDNCSVGDLMREHYFHPSRRWRFDIAWPSQMIAIEIDGGGFGHQSMGGRQKDNEKQNAATSMGWRVFRFCTGMSHVRREESVLLVWNFMTGEEMT